MPYIKGEKQAPVKTYFIGGWGHGSKQALEALEGVGSRAGACMGAPAAMRAAFILPGRRAQHGHGRRTAGSSAAHAPALLPCS